MNPTGRHIWRGALFLFVSVGFTRALFAIKEIYSALFDILKTEIIIL